MADMCEESEADAWPPLGGWVSRLLLLHKQTGQEVCFLCTEWEWLEKDWLYLS